MEFSDVKDVIEIIKMFLSSSCLNIEDSQTLDQLYDDWIEALEAGTALRKKMVTVVLDEAGNLLLRACVRVRIAARPDFSVFQNSPNDLLLLSP